MRQKTTWIVIGDFFFKYRNKIFPVILIGLFVGFKPTDNSFPGLPAGFNTDWLAIVITASGLACRAIVIGFAYIKRGGLKKQVYAEHLVTTGFFGVCRNPLYIGNMLIYAGVFLMHGNPYVVVFGTASYYIIYESIIAAEEYFLRGEFGDEYAAYCRDVPRWLPKFSRFKHATEGMRFNIRRVIIKDYPTIANAVIALMGLELYEAWYFRTPEQFQQELKTYGVLIVLILIIAALISLAKKRKLLTL